MGTPLRERWHLVLRGVAVALRTTLPYMLGLASRYREVTEEYPDRVSARMPEDLPARYRGFLHNDIELCSGCRYCADVCPIDCIQIETEPGPERNLSWVAVFDIDASRCMFCGLCVEVCPTGSLNHTKEYQGSVFRIQDMVLSFGKGIASTEMREKWSTEQRKRDLEAEDRALLEQSPAGGELLRRNRQEQRSKNE